MKIALFKYELNGAMIPVNKVAEDSSARRDGPDGATESSSVPKTAESGHGTVEESPSLAEVASGLVALLSLVLLVWNIVRVSKGEPDSALWHLASNAGWLIPFSLGTAASARSNGQRSKNGYLWTIPWIALLTAFSLDAVMSNKAAGAAVILLASYANATIVGLGLIHRGPIAAK